MRVLTILFVLLCPTAALAEPFNFTATTTSIATIPQWVHILQRRVEDETADYAQLLREARASDNPVATINRVVNDLLTYVEDRGDAWQTPHTTLVRREGDCEDYAIFKYFLLRDLGYTPEQLRIVAGTLPNGSEHMVLALDTGNRWIILDNRSSNITAAHWYRIDVAYTFNETVVYLRL